MNSSFPSDPFGSARRSDSGNWPAMPDLMEAMNQLRTGFEQKFGGRMGRGDVRAAVLALLAEKPMHGYQIIHEIDERSHGMWKPSPGSIYPTLQMLADEGLIEVEESDGKKVYTLTESGRAEADASGESSAPWESQGMKDAATRATALPKAGAKLAQAAAQVGSAGTPEQVADAVEVLEDARRKLYAILARD